MAEVGCGYYTKSLSLFETSEGWLGLSACLLLQHQQREKQQQQLLLQAETLQQSPQDEAEQRQQERKQQHLLQQTLEAAAAANGLNPTRAEPWGFLCLASLGLGRERQAAVCCRFFFKSFLNAANTLARHNTIVFRDAFKPLPAVVGDTAEGDTATAAAADGAVSASPRDVAAAAAISCWWFGGLTLRMAAALLQQHQQQRQQQQQQGMKAVETARALALLQTPEDNGKP